MRIPVSHKRAAHKRGKRLSYRTCKSLDTDFDSFQYEQVRDRAGTSNNPLNKLSYELAFSAQHEGDADHQLSLMKKALRRKMGSGTRNFTINDRVWFHGETMASVARDIGLSRERVRQLAERGRQIMIEYVKRKAEGG